MTFPNRFRRIAKRLVAVLAVTVVAVQLVPIDRTNPPVESSVPATVEARSVLRRACFDCHSNETVWPWYSRIAPVSWLVMSDVREGRDKLNFSTWSRLSAREQAKALGEARKEIEDGDMPPWLYLLNHQDARLSAGDRAVLTAWSNAYGVTADP